MPSPNVDSAVIRLDIDPKRKLPENEERMMFRLIRAGFSQRRKQLANPLSSELRAEKAEIAQLLADAGIKPTARAEELQLSDYQNLARIAIQRF